MRRYFLTGCTGFLGKALVAELCRQADTESVVLLTRDAQTNWDFYGERKVQLYEGNIEDVHFPFERQFTDIIHGASEPLDHDDARQKRNYYTVVEGTNRLLDWACRFNPRILILSSGCAPHAKPYCQAKRMSEFLLRCNTSTGKIARIFSLIGNRTPTQYAVGLFCKQAVLDGKVTVRGGENIYRSYLHVEDCARWLLAILDRGLPLRAYEVGGRQPYSVMQIAEMVSAVFGVPIERIQEKQEPERYVPDLTAADELGLVQTINLTTALERIRAEARLRYPDLEPFAAHHQVRRLNSATG